MGEPNVEHYGEWNDDSCLFWFCFVVGAETAAEKLRASQAWIDEEDEPVVPPKEQSGDWDGYTECGDLDEDHFLGENYWVCLNPFKFCFDSQNVLFVSWCGSPSGSSESTSGLSTPGSDYDARTEMDMAWMKEDQEHDAMRMSSMKNEGYTPQAHAWKWGWKEREARRTRMSNDRVTKFLIFFAIWEIFLIPPIFNTLEWEKKFKAFLECEFSHCVCLVEFVNQDFQVYLQKLNFFPLKIEGIKNFPFKNLQTLNTQKAAKKFALHPEADCWSKTTTQQMMVQV